MSIENTSPDAQPAVSEAAQARLKAYGDAYYNLGSGSEDTPESLAIQCDEASKPLEAYIASLEARLSALGEPLPAVTFIESDARTEVAELEFERYEFVGDEVEDYGEWGRSDANGWVRKVEVSTGRGRDKVTSEVTFHVRFGSGLAVENVYALDCSGTVTGTRGEPVPVL